MRISDWSSDVCSSDLTQAPYFNIDSSAYAPGTNGLHTFDGDFFAGNQMNHNSFAFFDMDKLENREQLAAALGRPSIGVGDYYPVCSGEGYRAGETVQQPYGCYLPSEIHRVSERSEERRVGKECNSTCRSRG